VGEILLIASDWRFRALVRAQLLDEGYAVRTLPSLEIALAYLMRGGKQPRLTILDAQGNEIEAQVLPGLWRVAREAPLVLCGGMLSRAALDQEGLPPTAQVLLRPFRVGDLVEEVQRVLACSGDETAAEKASSR
jgi:DNA-binding response OmpR family regulator